MSRGVGLKLMCHRCDVCRALATIQSTIGYSAPATNGADADVEMEAGAGETTAVENALPAEIEEIVSATHAR